MDSKSDNIAQNAKKINRSELLKTSSWIVDNIQGRLSKPRFTVQESDPVKLQYFRVLIQAVQAHNSILRDDDLEDIKTRLELIETALEARK